MAAGTRCCQCQGDCIAGKDRRDDECTVTTCVHRLRALYALTTANHTASTSSPLTHVYEQQNGAAAEALPRFGTGTTSMRLLTLEDETPIWVWQSDQQPIPSCPFRGKQRH